MKIGFIDIYARVQGWGGAQVVIDSYIRGLRSLGHTAVSVASPFAFKEADVFILTLSNCDLRDVLYELEALGKPFAVLGFHDDSLLWHTTSSGFSHYICKSLGYGLDDEDVGLDYGIERLFEMPHLANYYSTPTPRSILYNHNNIKNAFLWIANSPSEAKTMERDHPGARTTIIPIIPGMVTELEGEPDSSFLQYADLASNDYILQVGRLETRKNQLGTILATKDLDVPLVFIALQAISLKPPSGSLRYERVCFEAAARYRKAPTIFISNQLSVAAEGSARRLPMPEGKKLPISMLVSAFFHAGLHLHPAFNELPGLTYFEAARLGTPSVASSWCSITDYFYDSSSGHSHLDGRIAYTEPHHLKEISKASVDLFGKRFPMMNDHPSMKRTDLDMAKELIEAIR